MAYVNLVSQFCTNNAEAFMRLRDFLCSRNGTYNYLATGIGWVLHDAVYATDQNTVAFNDYFVAYSPGEDGNQDIYVKVTYISGFINIHTYLYWNKTTHTGVTAGSTANNWTNTNSTNVTLWVYGDLDSVVCIAKYGTAYNANVFGHCPGSQFATAVATSSGAVTGGSNVVVTVNSVPAEWAPGRKIYIRDNQNIEICTISNISGNNVTIETIVASYSGGCKLQGEVSYFNSGAVGFVASAATVISHAGTKSVLHTIEAASVPSACSADGLSGGAPMTTIFYAAATSLIGPLKNTFLTSSTGRSSEQTDTDGLGNTYRWFLLATTKHVSVREV